MITDRLPRNTVLLRQFAESDALATLALPGDDGLPVLSRAIETAMKSGKTTVVRQACAGFAAAASGFYGVRTPGIRVLASRPIRVREGWATELFGDYDPEILLIRLWMRTAVQKRVTSFGTFLSTLCHEFIHHLDCQSFKFSDTPHTRGFYVRTAMLYHHSRGTPMKELIWRPGSDGRWRIDWRRTNRGNR